jgi:ABC-3C biological conflict system middle component
MNSLTFQPAFDVFHTMFRYLRIRDALNDEVVHRDQLRIADFYLAFFFRAESIRLKPKDQSIRKIARRVGPSSSYQRQPDDALLFARMGPIQHASLRSLVHYGYFAVDETGTSFVAKTSLQAPDDLQERIKQANVTDHEVIEAIVRLIRDYPLTGRDGLKSRTALMEHRYDVI